MYDVAVITIGAVGTGKRSWVLPSDFQVAGVTIDNPSGSWLWIPQDNTFIAPYTLGFAHSFHPTLSRVDILFANGPAGQISTQQGDKPTATIYDKPVADSAGQTSSEGSSFVEQFTPVLVSTAQVIVPYSTGVSTVILAAIANKRYRVLTSEVMLNPFSGNPPINYDSPINYAFLQDAGLIAMILGRVSPEHPSDVRQFPGGMDFPVGGAIRFQAFDDFATNAVSRVLTYQVI